MTPTYKLNNTSDFLFNFDANLLEALKNEDNRSKLIQYFEAIEPSTLNEVLIEYFREGDSIDFLAEIIPYEKLQKAVNRDPSKALQKAKEMLQEARHFLDQCEPQASPSLKAKLKNLLDSLISFVETLLNAFGISDFFESATAKIQKEFKFQKIMMLISFFTMLSTTLFPLLGVAVAAPIIGGVLLVICVASIIYPKFRPLPSELPYAKNWTKMAEMCQLGDLSGASKRKGEIDEIARTLINHQKSSIKKHPLLIGPSRVGKTETAKAYTQAQFEGKYPELNDKVVFYLNAAQLLKKGDFFAGKDPLEQLREEIGRHKDRIVLVIDEIHTVFQTKNSGLAQKMKETLDPNGDFPQVIGITTDKEFKEYIQNDLAFVNRFQPIFLKNTDSFTTQEILANDLIKNHPLAVCEPGALSHIYKKTEERGWTQPFDSLQILQMCADATSTLQVSEKTKTVQEFKNKKEMELAQHTFDLFYNLEESSDSVESHIETLEKEIELQNQELEALVEAKKAIFDLKKKSYQTILKIASSETLSPRDLNAWTLMTQYRGRALLKKIKERSEKLNLKSFINEGIIDEAILKLEKNKKESKNLES